MNKIAFVYPGQGAQKTGMGADFYQNSSLAREVFDGASKLLKMDMKALCFEENDRLDKTEYTQAAMVTVCLAITRVIRELGIEPDVTAGLSLGEYCAIVAAGGMSEADAVKAVRARGILMEHAVPDGQGAMSAVMGLTGEEIQAVLADIKGVTVANYNCPGQIVITGESCAVERAKEELKKAGARKVVRLNVSGPFHSPMLRRAGEELERELADVKFTPLKIPYVSNVTAEEVTDIRQTAKLLVRQISTPVYWQQSVESMIAGGVNTFIEIGPGKTLSGFIRKINRDVKLCHVGSWEELLCLTGK